MVALGCDVGLIGRAPLLAAEPEFCGSLSGGPQEHHRCALPQRFQRRLFRAGIRAARRYNHRLPRLHCLRRQRFLPYVLLFSTGQPLSKEHLQHIATKRRGLGIVTA